MHGLKIMSEFLINSYYRKQSSTFPSIIMVVIIIAMSQIQGVFFFFCEYFITERFSLSNLFYVAYRNSAGFVYLRFDTVEAAMAAQSAMHLRWFARRLISALFMVMY